MRFSLREVIVPANNRLVIYAYMYRVKLLFVCLFVGSSDVNKTKFLRPRPTEVNKGT